MLNINYILDGITSIAGTTHRLGFHIFWASTSNCVGSLGSITGGTVTSGSVFLGALASSNCAVATRQSTTSVFESFEVGDLTLDSVGSGTLSVTIGGIPSGTYTLEFHVRTTGPCTFCNVILQAPGPTYSLGTVTITI